MRRLMLGVVVTFGLAAAPAQAHVLSFQGATIKAQQAMDHICENVSGCIEAVVIPARSCKRYSDHLVTCLAGYVFDDDVFCTTIAQVSLHDTYKSTLFRGRVHCS